MFKKIMKTKNISPRYVEEYHPGESVEELEMCRRCYAFKYDNEWHFDKPEYLSEDDDIEQETFVQFSICADCVEESLAIYDDMEYV